MSKSSSGDRKRLHPYIDEAIKSGKGNSGWMTSKIKRTETKVTVKIYEKLI